MDQGYERWDGCYGEVTGRCACGAYLTLDNGEEAFAYRYANMRPGTKVLCTVWKLATEGKRMVVKVDSVMEYAPMFS